MKKWNREVVAVVAFAAAVAIGCGDDGTALVDADPGVDAGPIDGALSDSPSSDTAVADSEPIDVASTDTSVDVPPACEFVGLPPGDHALTLDSAGMPRTFSVHVPESYDGSAPVPLVLNFHGFTSNGAQQALVSGMNGKSDEEGFIAVHANGTGRALGWNGGVCCGDAATGDVDDVAFVRLMIADVLTRICIDEERVFATGLSNGGFLSHRLACDASDVIAAIAPVAGVIGISDEECTPEHPTPVMHFHGTADVVVPYNGSVTLRFRSVRETIDGWVERNGCDPESVETFDMGDSHCDSYVGCAEGTEVVLCTVDGGAHWWPGGTGSTSNIDATDAMWTFFERFAR